MKKDFKKNGRYAGYLLALTLILSFLAFNGTSFGFQPGYHCGPSMYRRIEFGKFRMLENSIKELDLTKHQLVKLRKLRAANFKNMMKLRKTLENPMLAAWKNGAFNGSAFKAAALKNAKIMIDMKEKSMQNFLSVLTPKQTKEFFILLKIKKGDWGWYKP